MVKINIFLKQVDQASGGGNQFLKALRRSLEACGAYEADPLRADCVIVNSHHELPDALKLKRARQDLRFIHRIDGPIVKGRKNGLITDFYIHSISKYLADAMAFQSPWSRDENIRLGMDAPALQDTIVNAVNRAIFYPPATKRAAGGKIRIVSTTWSPNAKKGFDIYRYLDEHLDFDRYDYDFIGNSPAAFKNIKLHAPQDSERLAESLRDHDIYLTASLDDPCSNALLEGLCCGLACIARNSGGHPFILSGDKGLLFDGPCDVLAVIDRMAGEMDSYRMRRDVLTIEDIRDRYIALAERTLQQAPKRLKGWQVLHIWAKHALYRLSAYVPARWQGALFLIPFLYSGKERRIAKAEPRVG